MGISAIIHQTEKYKAVSYIVNTTLHVINCINLTDFMSATASLINSKNQRQYKEVFRGYATPLGRVVYYNSLNKLLNVY